MVVCSFPVLMDQIHIRVPGLTRTIATPLPRLHDWLEAMNHIATSASIGLLP